MYIHYLEKNDKGVLEIEIKSDYEKKYDIVLWDIKKVINLYFKNAYLVA